MTGLLFAMWCVFGVVGAGNAAGYDQYVVATDRLNVRASPSHEAPVHFQIERGRQVIEMMRSRLWVYVRVRDARPPATAGWVHGWYLAKADELPPVPARATTLTRPELPGTARPPVREATAADVLANARQPLREFRAEFGRMEARYTRKTGASLFSKIAERPGRILILTATDYWLQGTDSDRQHDLYAILGLWKTANSDYPVVVEVRSAGGEVLLTAYE